MSRSAMVWLNSSVSSWLNVWRNRIGGGADGLWHAPPVTLRTSAIDTRTVYRLAYEGTGAAMISPPPCAA